MDKSKINTNQTDGNEKTLKGLENRGLVNFECADCNKFLLVLQLVDVDGDKRSLSVLPKPSEVLTRVAVRCGFCGGSSCVQQIYGSFYPGASNDNMLFDVLEDDGETPEADVLFRAWSK